MSRNAIASKAKKRRAGIACKTLKGPKLLARPKMAAAFLGVFALCGCASLRRAAAPVVVYDARVCSQEAGGRNPEGLGMGVEFVAVNLCGRPIQSVSFRICAAEREEGGGADGSGDYGVAAEGAFYEAFWTLEDGLDVGEERTLFVPLEDAPPDCDADDLEVEGVYVENAIFCD